MKKLYFVRHGFSEGNKAGVYSGRSNHPLTKQGEDQAKKAGQAAKDLGIDLIISSTQLRALETAKFIANKIGYPVDKIDANSLLVERDFGDLEGKPGSMSTEDLHKAEINGFETDDMLLKRAEEAFELIQSLPQDNIMVVSHSSFGRSLRKVVLSDHDFHERIENAQILEWL